MFTASIVLPAKPERDERAHNRKCDAGDVFPEHDHHAQQRAEVEEYFEGDVVRHRNVEHVLGEHEMSGAADGEELRQALNEAEGESLEDRHLAAFPSETRRGD